MIASEHRKVYNEVYSNDYYVSLFEQVCEKYGGLGESFGLQDPEKINSFWNDFWYALPDTKSIRRAPFGEICDLAEGDYLIGE
jgi:hypothetical protein